MSNLEMPKSMLKRQNPKLQALVDAAVAAGATWRGRTGPHYILRMPSGRSIPIALSPSDYRGLLNKVSQLRRLLREEGIAVDPADER